MDRRKFIQLTSAASVLTLLPTEIFALYKSAGMDSCPNVNNKKIVLIQLFGANDGLNTIVPLNQYDLYANLRPNIKLNNVGETNGVINLDTTLGIDNQVGLHPSLTGFKELYDAGKMHIIQGAGYPNIDKSHFTSSDLWMKGGDGTAENSLVSGGWMGRFLESYYSDFLNKGFPLGIQLGSNENTLGYDGIHEHGMSININGQDPAGFYSVINGLSGVAPSTIPNSEYGDLIQYILDSESTTNSYSQTITTAFNAGKNAQDYPDTTLSNQLKTVARLISGGLQSKIYLVRLNGFDNHARQVEGGTSHIGIHADLLTQVSEAVNNFIKDLDAQDKGDDVVALTFSEFGRKAKENGNLGTDHGEAAPMFLFGNSIKPGVSGTNVNLAEPSRSNNYQLRTIQHDYRRVYATILQDWLGVGDSILDLAFYDYTNNTGYSENKIPDLIKANSIVPESCYRETPTLGNDVSVKNEASVVVYPNPCSDFVTIQSGDKNISSVWIYSAEGRKIAIHRNPKVTNSFTFNVQQLPVGIYMLKINAENSYSTKKIIVSR